MKSEPRKMLPESELPEFRDFCENSTIIEGTYLDAYLTKTRLNHVPWGSLE